MGYNVHEIQNKVVVYDKRKKIPKIVSIFLYDSKINFQDETQNLTKYTHFEKFIFIQQWLTQNMWSIGPIICIFNNKLQKFS